MKVNLILLVVFWAFCGPMNLWAGRVEKADARRAALNAYTVKAISLNPDFKGAPAVLSEYSIQAGASDVCYVFNMNTGGWVILAADDRVYPLLAFSPDGVIDPAKGSPEFQWWMDGYKQQINYAVENDLSATTEIKKQWHQWLSGDILPETKGAKSVLPLMTSTWDQGAYYNMLCPEDPGGPAGHVWAGCVATCMAQLMYYYRYPLQGTGYHAYYSDYGYLSADFSATTYDWNQMEDYIGNIYNYPMAVLQYHLGIAVEMMYSPNGSGAYMWDAAQAMIDYFGYSPSLHLENNTNDAQWISMLKAELDLKQPLCYAGYGNAGGHAFNCDGYQGSDHFHFNWGWSGYANGYYYISNLNPSYDFTNGQQAIFGAVPASGYPYACNNSTTLTSIRGTFEDGSGPTINYASGGDCSWLIAPDVPVEYITLRFNRFDTEHNNDIITVYDGPSTSDSILGVFSGSTLPPDVKSTGNKMLVRFTTNNSVNAQGWLASFNSQLPLYCEYIALLTDSSGSFGDGSGPNPYNNSTVCRWRIRPPGVTGITINFNSFNLEGTDFVKIFNEEGNVQVVTFTGSTLPNSVFIGSDKALLLFMSDSYGTSDGFDVNYTSSTSGISGISPLEGLCVYPNPVQDIVHISSGIMRQEAVTLRLFTSEGKELLQHTITPNNGGLDETLDVSALSKGMYFLLLETPASRQAVRITKQ